MIGEGVLVLPNLLLLIIAVEVLGTWDLSWEGMQ